MQGGEEGRTYRPLLQKVLGSEMELCVSSKVDQAEGPASGSMRAFQSHVSLKNLNQPVFLIPLAGVSSLVNR
jgi:hypothetical protein